MIHDEHDHRLATEVASSYPPGVTTAQVNDRVADIISDFEHFRRQVRHIATLAGFATGLALAAIIWLVVIR
jgi:hypothetical protein